MKRRPPPAVQGHDVGGDELTDFDLWCAARGIPHRHRGETEAEITERITVRHDAWQQWCAARAAYAAEHEWPGGYVARKAQQSAAYPGGPFPWHLL